MNSSLDVIKNSTIYIIDSSTGNVLAEHGENEFYMPHGMTVDSKGNLWVTDVARHQVLRLCHKTFKPTLVLGEKFIPGDDESHFCQPTDIAVSSNGKYIFVADGYCNARIMKFDSNGTFIEQFGTPPTQMPAQAGEFFVPHSIALIENLNLLCVADRENQRIQCFSAGLAQGHRQSSPTGMFITKAENIGRVYAIREKRHYLVGITGKDSEGIEPQIFVMDMDTGKADTYAKGVDGHSLAVDTNGNVFIARMHPNQILHMQL
jgi:DNA-binding beta-propeller fold protein YncE